MEALSALIVKEGTAVMVRVRAVCGTRTGSSTILGTACRSKAPGQPTNGRGATGKGCDGAGLGRFGQHKKHDRVPNTRQSLRKGGGSMSLSFAEA
jgi:hypothetical protein